MIKTINYDAINELCNLNIEVIFENLGIDVEDKGNCYQSTCPIHNGDNPTAFTYYKDSGVWQCWTHRCEADYPKDPIGFISAFLKCSPKKAVEYVCGLFKIDNQNVPTITSEKIEILKFIKKKKAKKECKKNKIYSEKYITRLSPSNYFLNRGFNKDILDLFGCGYATRGEMSNRVVFPIRDISGSIVGFTGRTIFEKCERCLMYHNPEERCYNTWSTSSKWKKNTGFSQKVLYNLNNSLYNIEKAGTVVIVEGIPDVMRLHQNGIYNSVALLRGGITKDYFSCLMSITGLRKIYLFGDNDDSGNEFKEKHCSFKDDFKSLSRYFSVEPVEFDNKKDIGDMTDNEAKELIKRYNYFQI